MKTKFYTVHCKINWILRVSLLLICFLTGSFQVNALPENYLNGPPQVTAYWIGNAGAPIPSYINFPPCQNRILSVNAFFVPEDTDYYVWVFLPSALEVVGISGSGSVIDDPIYSGEQIVEIYFPGKPWFTYNQDVQIEFRLKRETLTGVDVSMYCWAYYSRATDEYPEEYTAKQMGVGWNDTYLVDGNNISLDELIGLGHLADPQSSDTEPQHLFIDGSLLVDIDYEFGGVTNDPSIIGFTEESGININDASLTTTGTIFKGCDEVWDAIEVQSGGTLITRPGNIGRVTIRDAENGVRLLNGSIARIQSTDFFDNKIGIYSPPGSSMALKNVQLNVRSSIFSEDENYQAGGEHPWAGIELHDMRDFISSCTSAPGAGCSNIIKECLHGIILKNTSANLSGFQIRDLWNDETDQIATANTGIVAIADFYASLKYNGYGKGSYPTFVNLADGICLQNVHADITNVRMEEVYNAAVKIRNGYLKTVILRDNYTLSGYYGLISFGNFGSNLLVESNDFRQFTGIAGDPQYGIFLANNIPGEVGIIVDDNFVELPRAWSAIHSLNNDEVLIRDNTIYGGDKANEYGIRVSGGSAHEIDCNLVSRAPDGDVADPGAGIYLQMLEGSALRCNATYDYPRGIEYFGMSLGTLMEANSLTDHRIGLLYDHEAESGIHEWSGNQWTNEYDTENDEIGARNTSDDPDKVKGSRYFVDVTPSNTHQQYGTSVESQHDWFILQEEAFATLQCGDTGFKTCIDGPGADHELPGVAPDSLAWRIAVDSFTSTIYGDGAKWIAQRQLIRRLMRWPEYITTGSDWEDFMNAHASSSAGIYEGIRTEWSIAQEPDPTLMAEINMNVIIQDSMQDLALDLMSQIQSAGTQVIRDSLQELLNSELDILGNLVEDIQVNYDSLERLRVELLEVLRIANAAAPDTTIWEIAQQTVNDIMYQGVLEGWNSVDSLQWVDLERIAKECPMVIGEAVFQSRSILQMKDPGLQWDDDARCSMAEPRSAVDKIEINTLSIFPNPANTIMYMDLTGDAQEKWQVHMYNSLGNLVTTWERRTGLQGIELSSYPNGIYLLQATNQEGVRKQIRLVITR